jgi:hypothetical protein
MKRELRRSFAESAGPISEADQRHTLGVRRVTSDDDSSGRSIREWQQKLSIRIDYTVALVGCGLIDDMFG